MVTKAVHNFEEIHIIFDTYRVDCIKSEKRVNGILDAISPKHYLLVLLKALPSVCMVYTAQGESQVSNIAQGEV